MLVLHFSSPWKLKAGKQRRWFGVRLRNWKKESCLENSSWLNTNHAVFVFFVPRLKELNHSFVRLKSKKKWVLHHPVEFNQYDSTFLPCRETPEKTRWCGVVQAKCFAKEWDSTRASHMNNHGECPWRPAARTKLRFSTHTETSTLPNA